MSEGLRDVLRVVTALAALLGAVAAVVGAVQSYRNGLDIAELRGAATATADTVNQHVNAAGLHAARD